MAFDLQVFNKQTHLMATEVLAQQVKLFNAASGGAIELSTAPARGDFDVTSSFKEIAGLVRNRDVYGTGSIAHQRLSQTLNAAVKVAVGTPTIDWTPAEYAWTLQNPELAAIKIGEQLGVARLGDMLNSAIAAAAAATGGNTEAVYDGSASAPTFKVLNRGAAKFGDRSSDIRAWVMHSTTMHGLYDNALSNVERLFTYEGVNVLRDPFGRLFIVSDSPALIDGSTYKTLGLTVGGVSVSSNDDFNSVLVPTVGFENIGASYQAEWSYNLAVRGYSWDMVAGGKSPNSAALATATNWDKTATSTKNTAGVLVLTK